MPRLSPRPALLRALLAVAVAGVAAPLAACHDFGDVTGSISGPASMPANEARLRAYADECQKRYDSNPGEKTASIEYARALRALTRYSEAVAVIQTAAIKAPKDFDVLGEYGKALADAGQLTQAKDVLSHAYTPDDPRWDVMSVQGTVADRLGDHAGAMQFYREALKIAPGEPAVLTNMGLSLALAKKLPEAEQALRQAVSSPRADARMRGDLALVLALEGKIRRGRDGRPGGPFARRRARQCRGDPPDDRPERYLARLAQARESREAKGRSRRLTCFSRQRAGKRAFASPRSGIARGPGPEATHASASRSTARPCLSSRRRFVRRPPSLRAGLRERKVRSWRNW